MCTLQEERKGLRLLLFCLYSEKKTSALSLVGNRQKGTLTVRFSGVPSFRYTPVADGRKLNFRLQFIPDAAVSADSDGREISVLNYGTVGTLSLVLVPEGVPEVVVWHLIWVLLPRACVPVSRAWCMTGTLMTSRRKKVHCRDNHPIPHPPILLTVASLLYLICRR